MAADACRRRDPGEGYGDSATCLALMAQIARAKLALAGRGSANVEVKQRSEQLKLRARYRSANEVVPTEDSVSVPVESQLEAAVTGQQTAAAPPQVLREDIWEVRRLLLH
jgi:hypothetical protein